VWRSVTGNNRFHHSDKIGPPMSSRSLKASRCYLKPIVRSAALMVSFWLPFGLNNWVQGEDWPAWRGPAGTGVSSEKSPPMNWNGQEKQNICWRSPLPDRGNSTPIVCGNRVFVTQAIEKDQRRTVMCFSRSDGKPLWQSGITLKERESTNRQNPYCSASPVTDGERVIASFGSAGVYCYDMDGKELWHRELGQVDSWHGSGSSPIIYHDLCILNFGPGTSAVLVACNKRTGEIAWKVAPPTTAPPPAALGFAAMAAQFVHSAGSAAMSAGSQDTKREAEAFADAGMAGDFSAAGGYAGSWSTPVVIQAGNHDELVVVHALAVTAYDPETGQEIWTCTGLPQQVFTSPAIGDGILIATGHAMSGGTQACAVKLGGRGDITATHRLWQKRLPNECIGSGVVVDERIYFVSEHGIAICLDLTTGEKKWEKRLAGTSSSTGSWSSVVLADKKLFIVNQAGETFIVNATPEFELLATNTIGDEITCASPVISGGQLFLRTYEALWCVGKSSE
jgi:outer membrane protein assembly factor BamB